MILGTRRSEDLSMMASKDLYEKKIWGTREARLSIFNGYYLTLKYCLESISCVKDKLVDIGCAAGAFTAGIKQYRPDLLVTGVDISEECIRLAKKRYQTVEFVKGDLRSLEYKKGALGAVTASHVLEHVSDVESMIGETFRVIKPGGIFYSATPLEGNWSALIKWLRINSFVKRNRIEYLGHLKAFSKSEYLALLTNAGFAIEKAWWSGHFSYQMIDVSYHILLQMFGMGTGYLLETQVGRDEGMKGITYRGVRGALDVVNNLEGIVLSRLPGLIFHVKARKKE